VIQDFACPLVDDIATLRFTALNLAISITFGVLQILKGSDHFAVQLNLTVKNLKLYHIAYLPFLDYTLIIPHLALFVKWLSENHCEQIVNIHHPQCHIENYEIDAPCLPTKRNTDSCRNGEQNRHIVPQNATDGTNGVHKSGDITDIKLILFRELEKFLELFHFPLPFPLILYHKPPHLSTPNL
jgi:hypothetical protein